MLVRLVKLSPKRKLDVGHTLTLNVANAPETPIAVVKMWSTNTNLPLVFGGYSFISAHREPAPKKQEITYLSIFLQTETERPLKNIDTLHNIYHLRNNK